MTGVAATLAKARGENRAALVGYLPVGFPDVQGSIEAMVAMVEAGVDVVEIGVPYSDPLMDGPVIQHAAEAALARRRPASPTCSPPSAPWPTRARRPS